MVRGGVGLCWLLVVISWGCSGRDDLFNLPPPCHPQVLKQAVGVVGAITPWNFPFSMITRKVRL